MSATESLTAYLAGDQGARERLWPHIYEDLHGLARRYMHGERPGHTLQPTAVVHEAFLRLIDVESVGVQGRTHFFALAATAMRRVLVDYARAHNAEKRGAGTTPSPVHESDAIRWDDPTDVLALDEAMEKLAGVHARQASVVELRFFGGLSLEETASVLGVSRDTVKMDWRFARAWLNTRLSETRGTR